MALAVWRCPQCSRILAKLALAPGSVVEVKCKSCGCFSRIETVEERIVTYPRVDAIVGASAGIAE